MSPYREININMFQFCTTQVQTPIQPQNDEVNTIGNEVCCHKSLEDAKGIFLYWQVKLNVANPMTAG